MSLRMSIFAGVVLAFGLAGCADPMAGAEPATAPTTQQSPTMQSPPTGQPGGLQEQRIECPPGSTAPECLRPTYDPMDD